MTEIIMPKMGLNMSEGLLVEWLAKTGDEIAQGQEIASIESEKVVNNIEAETGGSLHIAVEAGQTVPVGSVIGYLLEAGEQPPEPGKSTSGPARKPQPEGAAAGLRISPAARRKAQVLGIDLRRVSGTGPGGRITIEDVEKVAAGGVGTAAGDIAAAGDSAAGSASSERRVPFSGVRRAIAEAMTSSQRNAAEVTLTTEVDCSRLVEFRKSRTDKQGAKVSYNAMLIHTAAAALKQFPYMNAKLVDESIVMSEEINIGLAMEAEQGLVVPVVRCAGQLSVEQIQEKIHELIEKVHSRGATPDDFQGGTFTVTNLGVYGIDAFTPIINPGQTSILGVGRIVERAVVYEGKIEILPTCVLSLTFDHRLVDGAPAAKFLHTLKEAMENMVEH